MGREQREVFDEVAEAYDRARPEYPAELAEDVIEFARLVEGDRILEIGPGPGKATLAFAGRGFPMLCVEPGSHLAEILRGKVGSDVEVEVARFEDVAIELGAFGLVFAAQSFHWLDPRIGFARSAEALRPGGALAIFGNRPQRGEAPVHRAVEACYAENAPPMRAEVLRSVAARNYPEEIRATGDFRAPLEASYPFHREYDSTLYRALLSSQSDHRMLEPEGRERLFDAVVAAIDAHGGQIRVDYRASLILARRR